MSIKEIGLTGGIGSGKSYVARQFEALGYQCYYADQRAKALYVENAAMKAQVMALFGAGIYFPDGQLDRKQLGSIVFQDREKLAQLNAIVHPATLRDFEEWRDELVASGYALPFLLKEAAILYEAGSNIGLAGVISVYAPKRIRLGRVVKRDATDLDAVLDRMDKQYPETYKLRHADFIIYNDGHALAPQIQAAIDFFSPSV